jgi:hypothetical protein
MFGEYGNEHYSLWDQLSVQRLEAERLAARRKPKGDFGGEHVLIEDAWLGMPKGPLNRPLPIADLPGKGVNAEHDSTLVGSCGMLHPLFRIPMNVPFIEVESLLRAGQLLKAAFAHWRRFAADVDWARTQVVLFSPTNVSAEEWREPALDAWPMEWVPGRGFITTTQAFADWLPNVLSESEGAEYLLCLSVDSWAVRSVTEALPVEQDLGESIAALSLRRVGKAPIADASPQPKLFSAQRLNHLPRVEQTRKSTTDLEQLVAALCAEAGITVEAIEAVITEGVQTHHRQSQLIQYQWAHLPDRELAYPVINASALTGQTGYASSALTQLAMAFLTAKAQPGRALWVLDRKSETSTQGWLIAFQANA